MVEQELFVDEILGVSKAVDTDWFDSDLVAEGLVGDNT